MLNRNHVLVSAPRLLGLLLLLVLSASAAGQNFPYHFEYLTTDDGLPQNTVDAIYRDSRGFMWFATWNGLCRYDGYELRTFTAQPSEGPGLPHNFVRTLAEDPQGTLWIGTVAGIALYDLGRERFVSTADLPAALQVGDISVVVGDATGAMRIGTRDGQLFVVPPGGGAPTVYALGSGSVNAIEPVSDGRAWIGTDDGLWTIGRTGNEPRRAEVSELDRLPTSEVLSLHATTDTLWIGTMHGLLRKVTADGAERLFVHDPADPGSLVHNSVTAMTRDGNGRLLLGTLGGLATYQPGSESFGRVTHRTGATPQLNNTFVNSLLADDVGNVWVGTEKGGVNRYNLHQHRFGTVGVTAPPAAAGLNAPTVNSILAEGNTLWLGTAGGGLNRYHPDSRVVSYYRHDPADPNSLSGDFVTSLLRDRSETLWIGTWGNGLNRMVDAADGSRFVSEPSAPGFISSLWEDPRGFLLVGALSGLYLFDPTSGTTTPITDPDGEQILSEVGCLLRDRGGRYWVGTRRGLYRFPATAIGPGDARIEAAELEHYRADPSDSLSLPGDYVLALRQARDGRIWLGTYGHGIAYTQENGETDRQFHRFDKGDGLCNNVVYSIEEDSNGRLWLGTDHGLAAFDPRHKSFRNYFVGDGLLSNQFYWSASHRDDDGRLYFGTVAGLNYFHPEQLRPYPYQPRAILTRLEVLNEGVVPGEVRHGRVTLDRAISEATEVHLSYLDNAFSIGFSSLDYFLPEQARFAYRLEGVDQEWVTVSSDRRFASYTNLSGGTYTFRVRAAHGDGQWQDTPTALRVIVYPPFWKTLPFRLLAVALLVLLVIGYVRWRIRYLRRQTQRLELQVRQRTLEIERQKEHLRSTNQELGERQSRIEQQARELAVQRDQLIDLNERVRAVNELRLRFFTNISHEFRTPLTLIIDPVASLLRDFTGSADDRHTLTVINRNAQRLLHLINQLMTFRQLEEGKTRVRAARTDVNAYLRDLFASFTDLAEHRGIDFRLRLPDRETHPWLDTGKVEHILYNLLANAFKYTGEGGSIRLSYRQETVDRSCLAVFRVVDTGAGMEPDHLGKIFEHFYQSPTTENATLPGSGIGLSLTRELAELLGGTVSATSAPGRGSAFTVSLPCSRSAFPPDAVVETDTVRPGRLTVPVAALREELLAAQGPTDSPAPAPERGDQPLVLVVEDNRELRELLVRSLRPRYRVLQASDGREGYALAREHAPDLLVSDIMMPHMDGLELCRRLRSDLETSHVPIVLLTARALVENQLQGLAVGADDYLPKPFDLRILLARIESLIASRERLRRRFLADPAPAPAADDLGPVDEEFLEKVYTILGSEYTDATFSHDQLAAGLCVSRSLLYKKIKSLTGLSVSDFVNVYKLKRAAQQLREAGVPVSEAAYACGFSDPKYFSRLFKKFFGVSPSAYARGEAARNPLPQA
ncbi:two-component regulator propeller domain-containing protein [Lewinella sp. IMCC34183]|uniref:two-component regulator propeller domain-containing protein n=1 Tax=Lewinella sp. IMCC34183 TaxID=2248762 RepID=UPI000E23642E|nr:two-component regulator propeller domain-containing protein [Lewinella sp. IMCC34183]